MQTQKHGFVDAYAHDMSFCQDRTTIEAFYTKHLGEKVPLNSARV